MKSLKLLGLSLMAVFALGVFAAASASAEEGFLTGGSGTPTTATILGGESQLGTSNKSTIICKELDDSSIKFSNDKTATGTLHWLGCKSEGFPFNSEGDNAEVVLAPVKFSVCLQAKNAAGTLIDEFGIAVEVVGTLKLKIPALGIGVEVKGAILGAVLTTGSAKLFNVEFTSSATPGEQAVKTCLVDGKLVEHNLLVSFNKGAFELANEGVKLGLIQFAAATTLMT